MDVPGWLGVAVALIPIWALLIYAVLRLTGRIGKPAGLPPGRSGGIGRISRASGIPLSDAPEYGRKLNEGDHETETKEDGGAPA